MKLDDAIKIAKESQVDYDGIAEEFSQTRTALWEADKLKEYSVDGQRVLDLGCGNGRLVDLFEGKNVEYIGIDNSRRLLELAKQIHPERQFDYFNGFEIPFQDNSFDEVFSLAVMHHIPGAELRDKYLQEARRVLKKDGRIIISVWYLWQRSTYWKLLFCFAWQKILGRTKLDFLDLYKKWGTKDQKRYFHMFRKGEMKRLVERNGFKIEKLGMLERGKDNKNIFVVAKKV